MTKKEWVIFFQGIIGTVLLYFVFPDIWWKLAILNYCFAFVYEASMNPLFTYHEDLVTDRCIRGTDLNFLFPMGWNLIFSGVAVLSNFLGGSFLTYIVAALFIGNIMEITYFNLGYWKYNFNEKYLGLYKPFLPKVLVFGVPIQIIFGYSLVGFFVWFLKGMFN